MRQRKGGGWKGKKGKKEGRSGEAGRDEEKGERGFPTATLVPGCDPAHRVFGQEGAGGEGGGGERGKGGASSPSPAASPHAQVCIIVRGGQACPQEGGGRTTPTSCRQIFKPERTRGSRTGQANAAGGLNARKAILLLQSG